jgi:serine protease AprX
MHGFARARSLFRLLFFLAILLPAPGRAGRLSPDLSKQLQNPSTAPVRVIVETRGRPRRSLLRITKRRGGRKVRSFRAVNGFAVELPLKALSSLARRKDVLYVVPDRIVRGAMDLSSAATGAATARADTGLDGAGIGVAVLDTGVAPHPDLVTPTNRITGWVDLVNGRPDPYDDSGHGTHVAGIIAGNGASAAGSGRDLHGIAPAATIIGVKVLDENLSGPTSTVIAGLDWCLRNRRRYKIRVVNLSLGHPVGESYTIDPLCRAVEKLCRAGLVVVTAAGNQGRVDPTDPESGVRYGTITSPGNDPRAITVGATRTNGTPDPSDDEMATYSSRGPTRIDHIAKPDLVAPGNRVVSLLCDGAIAQQFSQNIVPVGDARYLELSGTSMAAPMVSGAAALMLQAAPRLDPDSVKARLMVAAKDHWNTGADLDFYACGAGLLDIPGALAATVRMKGAALSPTVARGAAEGELAVLPTGGGGKQDAAGQMMIWGDLMIWGDAPPRTFSVWSRPASLPVWGDMMIWGDALSGPPDAQGQMMIWGDLMIWGDAPSRSPAPRPSG